jgi:hypothetical protein
MFKGSSSLSSLHHLLLHKSVLSISCVFHFLLNEDKLTSNIYIREFHVPAYHTRQNNSQLLQDSLRKAFVHFAEATIRTF